MENDTDNDNIPSENVKRGPVSEDSNVIVDVTDGGPISTQSTVTSGEICKGPIFENSYVLPGSLPNSANTNTEPDSNFSGINLDNVKTMSDSNIAGLNSDKIYTMPDSNLAGINSDNINTMPDSNLAEPNSHNTNTIPDSNLAGPNSDNINTMPDSNLAQPNTGNIDTVPKNSVINETVTDSNLGEPNSDSINESSDSDYRGPTSEGGYEIPNNNYEGPISEHSYTMPDIENFAGISFRTPSSHSQILLPRSATKRNITVGFINQEKLATRLQLIVIGFAVFIGLLFGTLTLLTNHIINGDLKCDGKFCTNKIDCPDDYMYDKITGTCLRFFRKKSILWGNANRECQNSGGSLISITTNEKWDLVFDKLEDDFYCWIGLQSNAWLNGQPFNIDGLYGVVDSRYNDSTRTQKCGYIFKSFRKKNIVVQHANCRQVVSNCFLCEIII